MMLVDVDRGKREGAEMAKALEGKESGVPPVDDDNMIRLTNEEGGEQRESIS